MTTTWTTKDGRKLPIDEMETQHLQRVLYMLVRRADYYMLRLCWQMLQYIKDAPDGAAMAATDEMNSLMQSTGDPGACLTFLTRRQPVVMAMVQELAKRGVQLDRTRWCLPEDEQDLMWKSRKVRQQFLDDALGRIDEATHKAALEAAFGLHGQT